MALRLAFAFSVCVELAVESDKVEEAAETWLTLIDQGNMPTVGVKKPAISRVPLNRENGKRYFRQYGSPLASGGGSGHFMQLISSRHCTSPHFHIAGKRYDT